MTASAFADGQLVVNGNSGWGSLRTALRGNSPEADRKQPRNANESGLNGHRLFPFQFLGAYAPTSTNTSSLNEDVRLLQAKSNTGTQ